MGESSGWQMASISVAEARERYTMAAFGNAWAATLVQLAAPAEGERVLDVACGTGVVARYAAPLVGPTGSVVGLDLNAEMLTLARAMPQRDGVTIVWRDGNATALPFPDASFDLVCCQQGLQYFAGSSCRAPGDVPGPRPRRTPGPGGVAWAGASALLCGAGRGPGALLWVPRPPRVSAPRFASRMRTNCAPSWLGPGRARAGAPAQRGPSGRDVHQQPVAAEAAHCRGVSRRPRPLRHARGLLGRAWAGASRTRRPSVAWRPVWRVRLTRSSISTTMPPMWRVPGRPGCRPIALAEQQACVPASPCMTSSAGDRGGGSRAGLGRNDHVHPIPPQTVGNRMVNIFIQVEADRCRHHVRRV